MNLLRWLHRRRHPVDYGFVTLYFRDGHEETQPVEIVDDTFVVQGPFPTDLVGVSIGDSYMDLSAMAPAGHIPPCPQCFGRLVQCGSNADGAHTHRCPECGWSYSWPHL